VSDYNPPSIRSFARSFVRSFDAGNRKDGNAVPVSHHVVGDVRRDLLNEKNVNGLSQYLASHFRDNEVVTSGENPAAVYDEIVCLETRLLVRRLLRLSPGKL